MMRILFKLEPAMSSSQNIQQFLRQTYSELAKAEKIGDYERCLKACTKILKLVPNDTTAQHCKIIALAQLQKFEDALSILKKNSTLSKLCVFEKAYCEYRLNQTAESLKTLQENADVNEDFRCTELLAQLLYRCERYEESYDLYINLLKNSEDEYDEERRANLAAVVSQLTFYFPDKITQYFPALNTYEQYYNQGCRLCALGQYENAIKYLEKAESLCRKSMLDDEVPEEEIEDEICCMRLQNAYCHQLLGKSDEALKIYLDVSKRRPSDISLTAVAANNIVSLKKESNLFDARKKMKSCQSTQLQQKLIRTQKQVICFNNFLINLHSNQLELCRKSVEELRTCFNAYESALLCEAALLSRQKGNASAIEAVKKYVDETGSNCSKNVHCTLIQLFLNESMISQAVNGILSLDLLKDSPGILSLLVALCFLNEDRQAAAKILASTIDKLENSHENSEKTLIPILYEECATMYLNVNDFKNAANCLEELRKSKSSDDATVLARLVNVYLRFDPKKAEDLCKSLPVLDHLTRNLNIDSLESAEFLILGNKYGAKKATKTETSPHIDDANLMAQKKKRNKKRKVKLPKKMDPNVPPDPERWMPKYERSTYKKRKDKRAKEREIGRGTQGAVSGGLEFDSSAKVEAAQQQASPASPKPPSSTAAAAPGGLGPRQRRPLAQKPKKKKKNGKWT